MSICPLVLASSSAYRQALLQKLKLNFTVESPVVDESPLPLETAADLAIRLSITKAQALSDRYPQHLIIGADQVARLQNQFLSKPGNRNAAIRQLQAASGRAVEFFTGVCVLDSKSGHYRTDLDVTHVYFKALTLAQIERYLDIDSPYDCAGSFKVESFGIALFEKIVCDDHNALVGLPLIKLIKLLENFQYPVL